MNCYAELFHCQIGYFPIRYLGVPVSHSRLHIIDWVKLVEKMLKKLDVWKCDLLSIGGRIVLINASISSIPTYHMSMYLLPKTVIDILTKLEEDSSGRVVVPRKGIIW